MGYRTVLTLSGGTKQEELASFAYRPDMVVESVAEMVDPLSFVNRRLPRADTDEDSVVNIDSWRQASA
jgi:NagD protein